MTDELPPNIVGSMINAVASAGEQPELAWDFVQKNFAALGGKQGPSFRNYFVANFMTNFSDAERAAELARLRAGACDLGRQASSAARAEETIMIDAELKARALPAIDAWLKRRNGGREQ